jgi:uncharacterized protein YigA (DUF484 family)
MTTPLTPPVTEDDIANYLGNNPDFFERHAELLAAVHLRSPHNQRAVSLQERQAEMLRDKIRVLEHRIMEMIRHGTENVMLSGRLLTWAASLFGTTDAALLPEQIRRDIAVRFAVPQVALRLWDLAPAHVQAGFAQPVSAEVRQFVQALDEPFCGLNTGFELADWLADPQAAASLAVLPLHAPVAGGPRQLFGALVLASPDSQRFQNGMGTEFLERIAELCSAALARLR